LLSDTERVLLRRLSVFAGSWTLEAAEHVCADDVGAHGRAPLPTTDVLDLLTRLVDKSLVVLDEQVAAPRYRMLETVRQYAREKLLDANESERLRDRHLDYFMKLSEAANPHLFNDGQIVWLDRLELDLDNPRSAIEWSQERGQAVAGMRLASALSVFWYTRNHQGEGLARPEAAEQTVVRASALNRLGYLLSRQGRYTEAQPILEEALEIGVEFEDDRNIMLSKGILGVLATERHDYQKAAPLS
jgi:non-specific serine/threonine protein kinase